MTKSPIASPWGCAALSLALMSGPVLTAQSQTPADGGGQHEHGTQPQSGSSHGTAQHEPAMKGMTDAHFVQMMLKHHQQGIEMARIEEKGGASAEVKALATKIRQSQEREMAGPGGVSTGRRLSRRQHP